jgi:formate-dependent nitrite reductase membrane component NrfD
MKKHKMKKFGMTLVFALGVILSFAVMVLMVTGDVQKVVHFRGVLEEIVFTLFVGMLGIILLGSTISHILKQD